MESKLRIKYLTRFFQITEKTSKTVERLGEVASKSGSQISYPKKKKFFKRLSEKLFNDPLWIWSCSKQEFKNLKCFIKLTWNHYDKKVISINAKLCHYLTVILPKVLYAFVGTLKVLANMIGKSFGKFMGQFNKMIHEFKD